MRKLFKTLLISLFLSVFFLKSEAKAEVNFFLTVVGTSNLASLIDTSANASSFSNSSAFGFGFGGEIEARFGSSFGIEGGLFLQSKNIYLTQLSSDSTSLVSYPYIVTPLQVRFWINNLIGIGLGGYSALGLGNIVNSAGGVSVTSTYSGSNTKSYDYGLVGSVAVNLVLNPWVAATGEIRYLFGLCDINSPPSSSGATHWRDLQAFVGFRFNLMK